MTSTIEHQQLLSRFENVRETGDGQWAVRCPAHEDRCNSLSIGLASDGTALIHCHAGCSTGDVLQAVGLKMADLFTPSNRNGRQRNGSKIIEIYDYRDETGELLYQVCRMEPKDFRQRRPDGNGGWTWKTKGVRRVLYRLPELLEAGTSQTVFIVEGEKDADRLRSMGIVATCNVGGAGKWRREYADCLKGRRVALIADNDEAGHNHAQTVARSLFATAASVKLIELPNVPAKGDVSDWLGNDGTAADLLTLADETALWEPPADVPADGNVSVLDPEQQTDLSNAGRFVKAHGDKVRFCHPWQTWLIWDGARWKREHDGMTIRLAKSIADEIWITARDANDLQLRRFAAARDATAATSAAGAE